MGPENKKKSDRGFLVVERAVVIGLRISRKILEKGWGISENPKGSRQNAKNPVKSRLDTRGSHRIPSKPREIPKNPLKTLKIPKNPTRTPEDPTKSRPNLERSLKIPSKR